MSESWNDIGWTLFKDRQVFSNIELKSVLHLLKSMQEEMGVRVAMKSCALGPGPGVMLHREPGGQRRYKVKEQGVTSASSTSPKERGVKREVEI